MEVKEFIQETQSKRKGGGGVQEMQSKRKRVGRGGGLSERVWHVSQGCA